MNSSNLRQSTHRISKKRGRESFFYRRPAAPNPRFAWFAIAVLFTLIAGTSTAPAADPSAAIERSFHFIDKSTEATELLANDKTEQALALFQELATIYWDLDEDGYIATAIGDCLAVLGRDDEARQAYEQAVAAHPELRNDVDRKLMEISIAGNVDDTLLHELRESAQADESSRALLQWQLGRAIQKRAADLLTEAATAFRTVADAGGFMFCPAPTLLGHASTLEELADELGQLNRNIENRWPASPRAKTFPTRNPTLPSKTQTVTETGRATWTVRTEDGKRSDIQTAQDDASGLNRITIDGREVKLTRTQKLLIERYTGRINDILLEAANPTDP